MLCLHTLIKLSFELKESTYICVCVCVCVCVCARVRVRACVGNLPESFLGLLIMKRALFRPNLALNECELVNLISKLGGSLQHHLITRSRALIFLLLVPRAPLEIQGQRQRWPLVQSILILWFHQNSISQRETFQGGALTFPLSSYHRLITETAIPKSN